MLFLPVSRLFAHSSNYDMELTLDYNVELYPLRDGESFSLALASSLVRGGVAANTDEEGKDTHVWRPDGKGQRGLEDEYEYVMFGKVSISLSYALSLRAEHIALFYLRYINLTAERLKECKCLIAYWYYSI